MWLKLLLSRELKSIFPNSSFLSIEELAIAQLTQLQQTYPGAEIYLNGELTVDFPEDVKISVEPNQMVTAELVGSSLKLNYCELEKAIVFLNAQYATGAIQIKVVHPKLGV